MAPVTEVATLPLKAGVNPDDPTTPEGTILQEALATLSDQDGCQRIHFGREVENRTLLRMFIDWDSYDHHMKFTKTRVYQPFLKNLNSIMDGPPALFHIPFAPFPPTNALSDTSAPATEVLLMYFKPEPSSSDQEAITANLNKFGEAAAKNIDGFKGFSCGWSLENNVPHAEAGNEGAKVFATVIGWQSVDAHMAGRESQCFKDNIGLVMRGVVEKGRIGYTMGHINSTRVDGGGVGPRERGAVPGGSANVQEEVLNPQGGDAENQDPPPKTRADGTTTKNVMGAGDKHKTHGH